MGGGSVRVRGCFSAALILRFGEEQESEFAHDAEK